MRGEKCKFNCVHSHSLPNAIKMLQSDMKWGYETIHTTVLATDPLVSTVSVTSCYYGYNSDQYVQNVHTLTGIIRRVVLSSPFVILTVSLIPATEQHGQLYKKCIPDLYRLFQISRATLFTLFSMPNVHNMVSLIQ